MHNDEFHGQGGVYEVGPDGTRKLMERTLEPWEVPAIDPSTTDDDPTIPSTDAPKDKPKGKARKGS